MLGAARILSTCTCKASEAYYRNVLAIPCLLLLLIPSSTPRTRYTTNLPVQCTAGSRQCLPGLLGPAASSRALRLPDAAHRYPSRTRFTSLAAGGFRRTAPSISKSRCRRRLSLFVSGTARVLCHSNVRRAAVALLVLFIDYVLGFVSSTLEPRTQLALRYTMVKPVLASDRPGSIYALELAGGCCSVPISVYACMLTVSAQTSPGLTSSGSKWGGP